MKREKEALAALDALQAADSEDGYLAYKAELLQQFGHAEEAAHTFDLALADTDKRIAAAKTDTERMALRQGRAQVLSAMGRSEGAVRELDTLIAKAPQNPTLLNSRCWTRATANLELDAALRDCEAAVKAAPRSAAILDSRAFVKLRLGRYADAIADYDAALALSPQLPASLFGRGVAELRLGRRAAGEADIAAAQRIAAGTETQYAKYGVKP
jgi:tetratricopeptide (TPR) repeat protein